MASKITQLHVYLIGGVLMLLLGGGLWYTLIKPLNEEIQTLSGQVAQTEGTQVQVDGKSFTIAQATQAKEALEAAKVRRAGKERRLASLENRKRLPRSQTIDLGDGSQPVLVSRTMPRWLQLPRVLVETMENYSQKLAKQHRVKVTTAFSVPAPSTNPADIPKDIIARNLGSMTTTGRFEDVMRWAQAWNSAPLLVSVDGLKCSLADPAGNVTATSSLTVYLFPTGQAVEAGAAGAGAAGAAGAMPGGMPAGMPGMAGGASPGGAPPGGGMPAGGNGPAGP